MAEPTIGVSDALDSLSDSRPTPSSGSGTDLRSASASLERVTSSLSSMQAMFASNAMQTQQLTMAVQQQTQMLSSAIRQLETASRLQSMTASSTSNAPAMALRGAIPTSAPAAFFGTPQPVAGMGYSAPGTGQMFGGVRTGSAFQGVRGALGSGMSLAGGMDRVNMFSESLGSRAMSATMGLGSTALTTGISALMPGSSLMSFGGGMLGGMLGGQTGSVFGSMAGAALSGGASAAAMAGMTTAVTAAVGAAVSQAMDQIADIRGSGDMFANNAFRMGAGTLGGGRPSFSTRSSFGADILRAANTDLAYSTRDMQEVFASGIGNDLMRGVSSARAAASRVRELAATSKTISRTLGLGIREAALLQSELQDLGVTNIGSAIMGLRTTGLTRGEALSAQQGFAGRYRGLQGGGLFALGGTSIEAGQTAIMRGALSAEELAAIGGRGGAQMVYGQGMVGMMQGGVGQMLRAAAMGTGGFAGTGSGLGALSRAGQNATAANMLNMAVGSNLTTREMLKSPQAQANILKTVSEMADQVGGGLDKQQVMQAILMSPEFGMSEDEARAFLKITAEMPESLRRRATMGAQEASSMAALQVMENIGPTKSVKRAVSGATLGVASTIAAASANLGDFVDTKISNIRSDLYGIRTISSKSSDMAAAISSRLLQTSDAGRSAVVTSRPSGEKISDARNRIRNNYIATGNSRVESLAEKYRQETDPAARAKIAGQLMSEVTAGTSLTSPEDIKAHEIALGELLNIDISSARSGAQVSVSDEVAAMDSIRELSSMISGVSRDTISAISRDKDVRDYVAASSRAASLRNVTVSGSATKEQRNELSRQEAKMNAMLNALYEKYAEDPKAINQIRAYIGTSTGGAADQEKASELFAALRNADVTQGRAAGMRAFQRAGTLSSGLLRGLGLNDLAATISSGGMTGAEEALSRIRGDEKIIGRLRGEGAAGAAIATAAQITAGMGEKELRSIGAFDDYAERLLGEGGGRLGRTEAERLRQYRFGQLGAVDGLTTNARGGFTEAQERDQAAMAVNLHDTAALLLAVSEALKSMNIRVPPIGQGATAVKKED